LEAAIEGKADVETAQGVGSDEHLALDRAGMIPGRFAAGRCIHGEKQPSAASGRTPRRQASDLAHEGIDGRTAVARRINRPRIAFFRHQHCLQTREIGQIRGLDTALLGGDSHGRDEIQPSGFFPPPPRTENLSVLKNILLVLGVTLVCLLALEPLTRLFVDNGTVYELEMWKYATRVKERDHRPDIGHRHRANAHAELMGEDVQTDSHGFRSPPIPDQAPPGVARIAFSGDSIAMGWGVAEKDTL